MLPPIAIALPLIRPGLAATALLIFALCWNEYLFGVYLATEGAGTLAAYLAGQVAVREQMASAEPQGAFFAALILISVVPPLLCAVILGFWAKRAAATLLDGPEPSGSRPGWAVDKNVISMTGSPHRRRR